MNDTTPTESLVSLPVHTETPQTFAAKLREISYREPILPRTCAVDGCVNFTHALICQDCEIEIEALAQDEENRKAALAFWPAMIAVVLFLALLSIGCWELGQFLRGGK